MADLDLRADVMWVYEALGGTPKGKPPSLGAKGLYEWVLASPANQSEFYRNIWPKFAPSQDYFEAMERFRDDGRKAIAICDEFLAKLQESKQEEDKSAFYERYADEIPND